MLTSLLTPPLSCYLQAVSKNLISMFCSWCDISYTSNHVKKGMRQSFCLVSVGASWGLQDLHQDSVSPACQTSFSPSAFDQQSGQNFCNSLFTRCQCSREPSDMSTLILTYSLSHPYLICSCNDTSSDDAKHQLSAMTLLLVLNSQQ